MQQLHAVEQKNKQETVVKNRQRMLDLIPDWKDDAKRKAGQDTIRSYLKDSYKMTDVEIDRIQDPRTMAVLNEVVSLRQQIADANKAVKRVRQAPRVLRNAAGQFTSEKTSAQTAVDKLVTRAKKTGSRQDAEAAVGAILAQSQKGQQRSVDGRNRRRRGR
jgi:hypothetical protein